MEATDEESTPAAATGPTKKATAKKAEAEAPKKGRGKSIFGADSESKRNPKKTTAEKQAENQAPTETETDTGNQDGGKPEQPIPDQETPAEEATREETQNGGQATAHNPFAGDEDAPEGGQEDGQEDGQAAETVSPEEPSEEAAAEEPAEKPKSIFSFGPKSQSKASAG